VYCDSDIRVTPLTEHFIRCQNCGLPHDRGVAACEACGTPIAPRSIRPPAAQPRTQSAPPQKPDGRKIGMIIDGKYRLKAVLGVGAMATVFEAEHLALGRGVAIKMLHESSLKSRGTILRFIREARLAGSIGHPNICEVYDIGDLPDGAPYMVLELLRGRSLAQRIAAERVLPAADAAQILVEVLAALSAAHGIGVIHRDIKPDNIFLARRVGGSCMVKLLDFGILKNKKDEGSSVTRAGMVMGTPFYMAPEQARGDKIDHRVDLWAAGAVLYEALTGRRPFLGTHYVELMQSILLMPPRNPLDYRPDLTPGFVPILDKALEKNPADRYPDAQAFLRDIESLRRHAALWDGQVDFTAPASVAPAAPPAYGDEPEPESAAIPVDVEWGTGSAQSDEARQSQASIPVWQDSAPDAPARAAEPPPPPPQRQAQPAEALNRYAQFAAPRPSPSVPPPARPGRSVPPPRPEPAPAPKPAAPAARPVSAASARHTPAATAKPVPAAPGPVAARQSPPVPKPVVPRSIQEDEEDDETIVEQRGPFR